MGGPDHHQGEEEEGEGMMTMMRSVREEEGFPLPPQAPLAETVKRYFCVCVCVSVCVYVYR
jgi:hypothetical protein